MSSCDDVLVATEVVARAEDVTIIDRVSVRVASGEMVALTGPSGAGKTTLLLCLAGLRRIDSGSVMVLGEDIGSLGEPHLTTFRRDHFGFVFQAPGLLDDLSGLDNVALGAWMAGCTRREGRRRARTLMQDLAIDHLADAVPGRMSGGEAQRIAVARALVGQPSLLFADEPTGALDSAAGEVVLGMLRAAADRGVPIVLVTHDHRWAERADRQIELVDGRLAALR